RRSFADTVAMIDNSGVDWSRVVYHCFSEGPEEVRTLNERGGRASFTGIVTYKSAANVLASALAQGVEKLMLETDSPWLAPEPHRGGVNEPAFVALTAARIAEAMGVEVGQLAEITSRNAESFFEIT
ncbi:MAG TPA: TatD family hydrolase, partial [Opitutales bacterium]|nr:TatD family hydrolase [Opitutales bacterium]